MNQPIESEIKDVVVESVDVPVQVVPPKDSVIHKLVPPHDKKSRIVTNEDIDRVTEESKILHEICFTSNGLYKGAYAMHHSQIDDKDPLQFFVTADRKIIINPVVLRHSNYTVDSKEACMSFPSYPQVAIPRWQKMEVEYQTVMVDPDNKDKFKLSSKIQESLSGFISFIFQHEIDHADAKFIHKY